MRAQNALVRVFSVVLIRAASGGYAFSFQAWSLSVLALRPHTLFPPAFLFSSGAFSISSRMLSKRIIAVARSRTTFARHAPGSGVSRTWYRFPRHASAKLTHP